MIEHVVCYVFHQDSQHHPLGSLNQHLDLVLFCVSGVFFFERMGEELAAPKQLVFNSTTVPEGVNLGSVFSGDIVDWDGDGDWDLILCPTFPVILLALQEDNEFRIVPDADSPFRAVQFGGGRPL